MPTQCSGMTMRGTVSSVIIQKTFKAKPVMKQALKKQDQKADLNEPEQDCYGDGSVYRGVRSNDSEIRTIFNRSEPARKPMNGDEVIEAFCKADISGLQSFTEGVRCAEEFHKIGGNDE